MSIAHTLRRAAGLQEKIEALRGQLAGLLNQARAEIAASAKEDPTASMRHLSRPKMLKSSATKARASRERGRRKAASPEGARRSSLAGRKRASSPSGPLAPAVVKVLRSRGKAMSVRDILAGLTSNGYKFTSPEPKKNLAARIYRLSGVKQVAPGLFSVV